MKKVHYNQFTGTEVQQGRGNAHTGAFNHSKQTHLMTNDKAKVTCVRCINAIHAEHFKK
jgi:hypothetical protein